MLVVVRRTTDRSSVSDWLRTVIFLAVSLWINNVNSSVNCPHPAVPVNAELTLSRTDLTAGTIASYKCREGFELFGNSDVICQESGKWKGELPFCGTNVAYRKPTNQSTTVRSGNPENANSGQEAESNNAKCSETQKEASPWWNVDLLKPYPVKVVRITTRGCCGHQPLQDIEIRVGNSSSQLQRNPLCAWFPGTLDEGITKSFTCARNIIGQYVFLQLVGVDGSLSLCDVEVFTSDELSIDDCSPPGAPADLKLTSFNRTCYEFGISQGRSFKDARAYCQKFKGDLVHSMGRSTTSFLYSELERRRNSFKTQLVWIGAQKEPNKASKIYKWTNGETILSPAWGSDQPNNYNGEQNCVVLDGGRKWLWNDVGCNLDYLHWICQYEPSSCGGPDKKENTTIVGTDYRIGSIVQYRCPEGHMLVGEPSRRCLNNGVWSGSAPSCRYVNCGALPDIENGFVTLKESRTTFGAQAVYTCRDNYTLVGNKMRECDENEIWSESTPKCLYTWCDDPPKIEGGVVKVLGKKAGDVVVYSCEPGFLLVGKSTLSCEFGGKWIGKTPSCRYIDCGPPPRIQRGSYQLLNETTFLDSLIEYTCDADYWIDGEKFQRCTSEGKWSSDTPSCELITCAEPDVPPGSFVVGYDFNVNSAIEYHCEPGHVLKGKPTLTCLRSGEWSGAIPICEFIDCGQVPPLIHGEVIHTNKSTYLFSEITYKCSKGYRLIGPSKRICTESKQWSESMPKCEEIRCPEPILADHSILSVTNNDRMYGRTLIKTSESNSASVATYKVSALVKYRCERGYKIVGESLSTCEETGQWSGQVPECTYVDCGEPEAVNHGKVILTSNATYYGAIALYSCDTNFELDGVSRRICLENATWSLQPPICREIQCKMPEVHNGALFTVDTYSAGGTMQYSCPRGHNMQGNATRHCLSTGKWSGRAPLCVPVECVEPKKLDNGHVIVTNGTIYNSAIEYHCIPGFKRAGPYLRKCLETGNWSGEEPRCEVAIEEPQESSNLGQNMGIGASVVVILLILLGLIYLKLKTPVPVKNTDNIQSAEMKDDRSASVVSYSTFSDRNGYRMPSSIYSNVDEENMYNSPYEETGGESETYEPEPVGNAITINGVSVR
ncbi:sushi, von Willebrand factor type A, EGF and pentraxin domain-containing protein 1 [Harmonia axyridis]|uniref:sushi, von Willebrand factor type A, EGF and pentraxin domain-containing protein 1 n=1 Tax=Harmonia axyridis TaxID=115357 RepID=UPI001E279282|nr:sushi, von Willebrand factor type A, EGF and pentraxin domain-containing protein 1 [Harmonia axyridis]